MKRITHDSSGLTISDDITTRFEPWPGLPGRFKAYKYNRAYPMCAWACDESAILHPIPEQREPAQ